MSVFLTLRESLSLLWTRRFGTFWFASFFSSLGTSVQQVAQPWLLLSLGASSFLIGLDTFAMSAPVWLLIVVGGALADHCDRRRVIALFQSIQFLCPTAIVVLLVFGVVEPWMIIVLSLVVGITDALSMPSFQSIVPSIVAREDIGRGLALNSTQFNLSRVLGPSIAGMLMSGVGAMACFLVSAASYVPFIGVALWILPRFKSAPATPRQSLFSGTGIILREAHSRGALLTVLVNGLLCAPLVTFSPVLVKEIFHGDAMRFSIAVASFGVGGLLGALGLLGVATHVDRRRVTSSCALVSGLALVLVALDPWFFALPPLLALAGATMTASNISANSLLQATASPKLLGRTVSLFMLALQGGISIGALVTGAVIGWIGVQHAILVDGVLAIGVHAALARIWMLAQLPTPSTASSLQAIESESLAQR